MVALNVPQWVLTVFSWYRCMFSSLSLLDSRVSVCTELRSESAGDTVKDVIAIVTVMRQIILKVDGSSLSVTT